MDHANFGKMPAPITVTWNAYQDEPSSFRKLFRLVEKIGDRECRWHKTMFFNELRDDQSASPSWTTGKDVTVASALPIPYPMSSASTSRSPNDLQAKLTGLKIL